MFQTKEKVNLQKQIKIKDFMALSGREFKVLVIIYSSKAGEQCKNEVRISEKNKNTRNCHTEII